MNVCPFGAHHVYVIEHGFARCLNCHTEVTVSGLTDKWIKWGEE